MKTQIAKLRYARIAPRKMRLVADLMRGLSVNEAEAQLTMHPRRPAKPLLKLLRSAVANAKNNQKMDPEKLVIDSIRVDTGPMIKRMLPRARGSSSEIQKKMSNVTIVLREVADARAARFHFIPKEVKKVATHAKRAPKKEVKEDKKAGEEKGGEKKFFQKVFNRKAI